MWYIDEGEGEEKERRRRGGGGGAEKAGSSLGMRKKGQHNILAINFALLQPIWKAS